MRNKSGNQVNCRSVQLEAPGPHSDQMQPLSDPYINLMYHKTYNLCYATRKVAHSTVKESVVISNQHITHVILEPMDNTECCCP